MPIRLKELIYVLIIAVIIFRLAKPIALQFSSQSDFARRRTVWLILTIAAFLSPNFWLFALIAAPLLYWGGNRDSNPVAFYLVLLTVIPPVDFSIPVLGINWLFDLNIYRLLAFFVLIPAAMRLRRTQGGDNAESQFGKMDLLLLGFLALQVLLYVPPDIPGHAPEPDSATNMLRRAFLAVVDVYVVYYVASRSCRTRELIAEALAGYCLCCALSAAIAMFEAARSWLLYADIARDWTGNPGWGFYLMRGGALRAMAATGHPLALGFMLALAFGFWLYLRTRIASRIARVGGTLLFWGGLLAAYSRGPWLGAIVVYLSFAILRPRAFTKLVKAAAYVGILLGGILISPLGDRITSVLPMMGGTVDASNVLYREQLMTRSWELITDNPLFGDQLAYLKLSDLRQGQGIIDFVNTYAAVAVFYGFVGLSLFVAFILLALSRAWRARARILTLDSDLGFLGAALVASMVGTLLLLAVNSLGGCTEKAVYLLAALAIGYAQCVSSYEKGLASEVAQRSKGLAHVTVLRPADDGRGH